MRHEKVEQFIGFTGSKEPERKYDWDDSTICALGQFNGFDSYGWRDEFAMCNHIACEHPRTFGALHQRLIKVFPA